MAHRQHAQIIGADAAAAAQVEHQTRDLLGLVADTFQIGDGLADRQHQAQIGGGRLAAQQNLGAVLVDLDFERVDLEVVDRDIFGFVEVTAREAFEHLVDVLFDQAAHRQDLRTNILQLLIELVGNVMGQTRHCHGWQSPVAQSPTRSNFH